MPQFRNISPDPLHVGSVDGPRVEPDQVIDAPGRLVEELPDAFVVEHEGQRRAWPSATWALTGGGRATKSKAAASEGDNQ